MNLELLTETPLTYDEAKSVDIFKEHSSFENLIFDWDGWDQQGTVCFTFYDVVLKVDIGIFKKGEVFEFATVDYESCIIGLGKDEWKYDVSEDGDSWTTKEVYVRFS